MSKPLLVTCLALAAFAPAQGVVHPTHFTTAEAFGSNAMPLGNAAVPFRALQVHSGVPAGTIRGLAFRLDVSQTAAVGAFSAILEISMSTAATTPTAPSATFDTNHGGDRIVVLPLSVVQFPAASPGLAPRDFVYVIPFTTPFVHAGTGALCWDMRISNRSSTTAFVLDHAQASASPSPTIVPFGLGCTTTGGGGRISLAATASTSWTAGTLSLVYTGSRLTPNSVVSLSVGVSATDFLGLTLPLALPGTSGGPSGVCTLYNDSIAQVPVFTQANGTLASGSNISLTISPAMNGLNLFTQVVALDVAANSLGIVTSNGVQQHLVAPLNTVGVGNVTRSGSVLPTGTVAASRGAVTRFLY